VINNDPSVPGALAYHSEDNDRVDGFILAGTIMANGGVPVYNAANPKGTTVASALFHELAEAFIDPTCNAWWQDNNGVYYCAEVCDPVESNNVVVTIPATSSAPTTLVALSDFVLPAWRDPEAPMDAGVRFNYANTLTSPFALDHGGYYVKFDPSSDSSPQTVFGRLVPTWKRLMKTTKSKRIARRLTAD
jgi:hypothetical protein